MGIGRSTRIASPAATGINEPETIAPGPSVPRSVRDRRTDSIAHTRPGGVKRAPVRTVARPNERRSYGRIRLSLSLRVRRVAGQRNADIRALRTENISSSGVYFLSPRRIEPGTPIELEVLVANRPFGRDSVQMRTEAHVIRADSAAKSGWHGLAAAFDDISFVRDESLPPRF